MPSKGVFVDDEDKIYAALLTTRGELVFDHQEVLPLTEQALAIRALEPTVVALDYRLDEVVQNIAAEHTYKGSALAQLLRDYAISAPETDFAIVLVSNEQKLEALYVPDKTAHDLFDLVYSKRQVTDHKDRVANEVRALSEGYLQLRGLTPRFDPFEVLAAEEDDRDRLSTQEITTAFERASVPHIAAKIVLRHFIERPGLLIDDADAAALLGLTAVSFEQIAGALSAANLQYRGVFARGWRRWWTQRLEAWGEGAIGQALLSMTSSERAAAFSRHFGQQLAPAKSPWNGSEDEYSAFACASCRRPTEMRHSLAAFDPTAPKFATRRRICWDCIQTDRYSEPPARLLVDESDEPLIETVRRRSRKA